MFHTVGNPDGKRNGVMWVDLDAAGNPRITSGVIIPQTNNPAWYGFGQPSVTTLPDGNRVMFVRADGPSGENTIRAFVLQGKTIYRELSFVNTNGDLVLEDGASPEIFWINGALHMLVLGGGMAALRKYNILSDFRIERVRLAETVVGGLWGFNHVPAVDMVDGAGIVRGVDNKAVIVSGKASFWRGAGDASVPGTWRLVKGEILV
jgi:hypothetical protein